MNDNIKISKDSSKIISNIQNNLFLNDLILLHVFPLNGYVQMINILSLN